VQGVLPKNKKNVMGGGFSGWVKNNKCNYNNEK
jgi:hypothetical protein